MTESVRPHDPRAHNALKHGLAVSVVPEHELEAFGRLRARLLEELSPVGFLEESLVERMARAAWHRERLERWEASVLQRRRREAVERALFPLDRNFQSRLDWSPHNAGRPPQEYDLPGVIVAISKLCGRDPCASLFAGASALEFVPGKCKGGSERVRGLYDRAAHLLSEQVGLASIASDDDLARYQRYASHHDRDFYRALHELEARQSARRGQPLPLARLEVHGSALPGAEVA